MDIFRFEGNRLLSSDEACSSDTEEIMIISPQELDSLILPKHWYAILQDSRSFTHAEASDGLLLLLLKPMTEDRPLAAICAPGQLILVGQSSSSLLTQFSQQIRQGFSGTVHPSGVLGGLQLLLRITADFHQNLLEKIEESLTLLETQVLSLDRSVTGRSFIDLRKSLLLLKRHTQPLDEVCDMLQESKDRLFPESSAWIPAPIFRRFGRINAEITNLENYVAQVRDAYQNHLDLRMNRTMMTLTVLAAIFLPLSLIVGWYGMNFPMPEFSWHWGYGYVIVLSLVSLVLSILYFHRKGML